MATGDSDSDCSPPPAPFPGSGGDISWEEEEAWGRTVNSFSSLLKSIHSSLVSIFIPGLDSIIQDYSFHTGFGKIGFGFQFGGSA